MFSQIPAYFSEFIDERLSDVVLPTKGLVNLTEGLPLSIKHVLTLALPK